MKKYILVFFSVFFALPLDASPLARLALSSSSTGFNIIRKSTTGFSATNTISSITLNQLKTSGGDFSTIDIPGYAKGHGSLGSPQLPVMSTLIEIPQRAHVKITITDKAEELIDLGAKTGGLKLIPRQPPVSKNAVAGDRPFHFDKTAYQKTAFSTEDTVTVDVLGNMRGVRIARLTINPFSYNPSANTLKVASRLSFKLSFENADASLTEKTKRKYFSPAFKGVYDKLANYSAPKSTGSKDAIISGQTSSRNYPLTYVVVASQTFLNSTSLKNFIAWKEQSGFHVIQANTDNIFYPNPVSNPSTSAKRSYLKTYLQALYNGGINPPSYVLFVGDGNAIPGWPGADFTATDPYYTDLYYCTFDSGYLPDAYYGRFSATTTSDLDNIINKTLAYEKYTLTSGDNGEYLNRCMVIAGAASDYGLTYANGQAAYLLNEYFNPEFSPDSINPDPGFSTIYAFLFNTNWTWPNVIMGSTSGTSLSTTSILNIVNTGVGMANYTGHCDSDGWWNGIYLGYEFGSSDIDTTLTNNGKYGFYVGNCCESSQFLPNANAVSFGEKMIRAQNKGAVGYIGASDITYWDEDFYWAVGYKSGISDATSMTSSEILALKDLKYANTTPGNFDTLWHTHNESESNWYITAGQMIYSGDLTVDTYSPANGRYYFEVYNLMGDPSLMPYLAKPIALATPAVNGTIFPCTTTDLKVATEPYAQVALTRNGDFAASAYSGSTGSVDLQFSPFSSGDQAELLVTKQNRQPRTIAVTVENKSGTTSQPSPDFMVGTDSSATQVEVTSGLPVTFTDLSSDCPTSYLWSFPGGSTTSSYDINPEITYNNLGTFDVILIAKNANGSATKTKTGYIKVVPGIYFTADQTRVQYGSTVAFTDQSTNSPNAWNWSFEGGTPATSTDQNPHVVYNTPRTAPYSVSLTVTINGTPYPLNKDAYITVTTLKPVAGFTSDKTSINAGESITFTDTSTNTPTQWDWTFTDGTPSVSTSQNPTVVFKTAGTHTITLKATNDGGSDTMIKTNYITVSGEAIKPTTSGSSGDDGGCFIGSLE